MKKFEIDKQTLSDLNIFDSNSSSKSIISLYNLVVTIKGREKLIDLFSAPTSDINVIKERQFTLKYLANYAEALSFDRTHLDYIESYLELNFKIKSYSPVSALRKFVHYYFYPNQTYYLKEKGIKQIIFLLKHLIDVFNEIDDSVRPLLIDDFNIVANDLLKNQEVKDIIDDKNNKINLFQLEKLDFIFRKKALNTIRKFIDLVYQIDANFAIVLASRKYNLTFPSISPEISHFRINGLFHPFIKDPIENDIEFDEEKNVCFLTGSNMAGKSTFLKSVGICVFLAHLGLPVPAKEMQTGIWQGLVSTINLPDNLNEGYSHFYNEVLRVKYVANMISNSKNIFVIFDELFRGTNVKDAYDGSLAVIKSFSNIKDCYFVISTHIVEVAESLKMSENISFKYLLTSVENNKPIFTYKLLNGITEERIGMWIIENEKILDILSARKV